MQIQVQLQDEDSEMLAEVLKTRGFDSVDQLLSYSIHRLASENDTDYSDDELTEAALQGLASGWFEGDPFARARSMLAEARTQRSDAA